MKIVVGAHVTVPGGLVESGLGWRRVRIPIRHGAINAGPETVLIDTGYGPRVTTGRRSGALRAYAAILRPRLEAFEPGPVGTIVLTHLHADHVARLLDFPSARIIASRQAVEWLSANGPRVAARHGVFVELLPADLATRFDAIEDLPSCDTGTNLGPGFDLCGDGSHLLVALPGHAPGHYGVFWKDGDRPTLYATDAAWTLGALRRAATPRVPMGIVFNDTAAARHTVDRIAVFEASGGKVVLCHQPEPT